MYFDILERIRFIEKNDLNICYEDKCVRFHLSPVTDPVPYVRCPVSCVTSHLSEKALTEPTARETHPSNESYIT